MFFFFKEILCLYSSNGFCIGCFGTSHTFQFFCLLFLLLFIVVTHSFCELQYNYLSVEVIRWRSMTSQLLLLRQWKRVYFVTHLTVEYWCWENENTHLCIFVPLSMNRTIQRFQMQQQAIPLIWAQQAIQRIIKWALEPMFWIVLAINKINGNVKFESKDVTFTIVIPCLIEIQNLKIQYINIVCNL